MIAFPARSLSSFCHEAHILCNCPDHLRASPSGLFAFGLQSKDLPPTRCACQSAGTAVCYLTDCNCKCTADVGRVVLADGRCSEMVGHGPQIRGLWSWTRGPRGAGRDGFLRNVRGWGGSLRLMERKGWAGAGGKNRHRQGVISEAQVIIAVMVCGLVGWQSCLVRRPEINLHSRCGTYFRTCSTRNSTSCLWYERYLVSNFLDYLDISSKASTTLCFPKYLLKCTNLPIGKEGHKLSFHLKSCRVDLFQPRKIQRWNNKSYTL